MKVTVCNDCGLAMHSSTVKVCRNCNQKNLVFHDMYCGGDSITFHKRVDQLASHHRKKMDNYTAPITSAFLLVAVTAAALAFFDYTLNPFGVTAVETRKILRSMSAEKPVDVAKASAKAVGPL